MKSLKKNNKKNKIKIMPNNPFLIIEKNENN